MRTGWRFAFILNGPAVAVIAALAGAFIYAVAVGQQESIASHQVLSIVERQVIDNYGQAGVVAAALWGFIFGSWFAMRRDKYFVESI